MSSLVTVTCGSLKTQTLNLHNSKTTKFHTCNWLKILEGSGSVHFYNSDFSVHQHASQSFYGLLHSAALLALQWMCVMVNRGSIPPSRGDIEHHALVAGERNTPWFEEVKECDCLQNQLMTDMSHLSRSRIFKGFWMQRHKVASVAGLKDKAGILVASKMFTSICCILLKCMLNCLSVNPNDIYLLSQIAITRSLYLLLHSI